MQRAKYTCGVHKLVIIVGKSSHGYRIDLNASDKRSVVRTVRRDLTQNLKYGKDCKTAHFQYIELKAMFFVFFKRKIR